MAKRSEVDLFETSKIFNMLIITYGYSLYDYEFFILKEPGLTLEHLPAFCWSILPSSIESTSFISVRSDSSIR